MEFSSTPATTCCFTGHRELPLFTLPLKKKLNATVQSLVERGFKTFICGGALGFDTLAAEAVLKMKREGFGVSLVLILPCRDQTRGWSDANERRYADILEEADSVEWICENYTKGCMHKRNRIMADLSSVCVAYLKNSGGGTAYTVSYAESKGLEIIHLA